MSKEYFDRRSVLRKTGIALAATGVSSTLAAGRSDLANRRSECEVCPITVYQSEKSTVTMTAKGDTAYLFMRTEDPMEVRYSVVDKALVESLLSEGQTLTESSVHSLFSSGDVSTTDNLVLDKHAEDSDIIGTCSLYSGVDYHYENIHAFDVGSVPSYSIEFLAGALCSVFGGWVGGGLCAVAAGIAQDHLGGDDTFTIGFRDCHCGGGSCTGDVQIASSGAYLDPNLAGNGWYDLDYDATIDCLHIGGSLT